MLYFTIILHLLQASVSIFGIPLANSADLKDVVAMYGAWEALRWAELLQRGRQLVGDYPEGIRRGNIYGFALGIIGKRQSGTSRQSGGYEKMKSHSYGKSGSFLQIYELIH